MLDQILSKNAKNNICKGVLLASIFSFQTKIATALDHPQPEQFLPKQINVYRGKPFDFYIGDNHIYGKVKPNGKIDSFFLNNRKYTISEAKVGLLGLSLNLLKGDINKAIVKNKLKTDKKIVVNIDWGDKDLIRGPKDNKITIDQEDIFKRLKRLKNHKNGQKTYKSFFVTVKLKAEESYDTKFTLNK